MKRRLIYAVIGLAYGLIGGAWAVVGSGGGHINIPIILVVSPYWYGVLLWPIWGFLAASFKRHIFKLLFLVLMTVHFAAVYRDVKRVWPYEMYNLRQPIQDPLYVGLFLGPLIISYIAAQSFLWIRFLSDTFRRSYLAKPVRTTNDAI